MYQKIFPKMIVKILDESRKSGSVALTGSREERKQQLKQLREKDILSSNNVFNFNLDRIEKRVNDRFIEVPDNIDSLEDFTSWLREIVK